jgi:tetratricopeptide (TPR) repeat protein
VNKNKKPFLNTNRALLIIIITTIIVFIGVKNNTFVGWDDEVYITQNPYLKLSVSNIKHSFLEGEYHRMYVPLTALSLSINEHFSGLSPKGYLITNLLLHLISVVLCFFIIKKLSNNLSIAFWVSLIFAIHPVQAEVVAYAAGRRDVLYTLFLFASYFVYLKYINSKESGKYLSISILFFTLSLFSKTQGLLFPFLLIATDYLYKRKIFSRKLILEKIPFFVLSVIFGIITIAILVKQKSPEFHISREVMETPIAERIIYAFFGFVNYIINAIFPFKLSLIHPYPLSGVPLIAYISVLLGGGLGIYALIAFVKKRELWQFGLLFFIISIVLMLQIFPNSYGVMNDHYMYAALPGLALSINILMKKLIKKSSVYTSVVVLYILTLSVISIKRVETFRTPFSVYSDVISKYPDSYVAYNNRGTAFYNIGKLVEAKADFNSSIEIYSDNAYAYNNRAVINIATGNFQDAISDLNNAISLKSEYADAYSNRAIAKAVLGDNSAIGDHNKAVELSPQEPKYRFNRGVFYIQNNNIELGCKDIKDAENMGLEITIPELKNICR